MLYIVLGIGILFMILERLIPHHRLPELKGWWMRVVLINLMQMGIIFLGSYTWDRWMHSYQIFSLEKYLHPVAGGVAGYFVVTFIFYWWHKWRHDICILAAFSSDTSQPAANRNDHFFLQTSA
jgi:hypothetical protein